MKCLRQVLILHTSLLVSKMYIYRCTYQWYKFPITPVKTSDLNLFLMLNAIYAVWNQVK